MFDNRTFFTMGELVSCIAGALGISTGAATAVTIIGGFVGLAIVSGVVYLVFFKDGEIDKKKLETMNAETISQVSR